MRKQHQTSSIGLRDQRSRIRDPAGKRWLMIALATALLAALGLAMAWAMLGGGPPVQPVSSTPASFAQLLSPLP